jgi:hypothetical protein
VALARLDAQVDSGRGREDNDGAALHRADLLLLQLEGVLFAARLGREHGALVVLNAAPATTVPGDMLASVGVLVVNQGEAAAQRIAMERGCGRGRPNDTRVMNTSGPITRLCSRPGRGSCLAAPTCMGRSARRRTKPPARDWDGHVIGP